MSKDKAAPEAEGQQTAGRPEKEKKAKAPKNEGVRLPLALEWMFTLSKVTVLLLGVSVLILSYLSGSPVWVAFLRSAVAILVVGLILWLITWRMAGGSLKASLAEAERKPAKRGKAEKKPASTVEYKA